MLVKYDFKLGNKIAPRQKKRKAGNSLIRVKIFRERLRKKNKNASNNRSDQYIYTSNTFMIRL